MANIYCNQSLGTGSDNGTDFDTNAYKTLVTAMLNTGAGDTLWVKNDASISADVALVGGQASFSNDPPRMIGCISAATGSTGTPPTAAHIVPGLRNGSSTRAYDQVSASAPPQITASGSGSDLDIEDWFGLIYGMRFIAGNSFDMGTGELSLSFEECYFQWGVTNTGSSMDIGVASASSPAEMCFKNSKFVSTQAGGDISASGQAGAAIFTGCIFDLFDTGGVIEPGSIPMTFIGCDFSAQSHPIVGNGGGKTIRGHIHLNNCKINASSALTSGGANERFRAEFIQTSSVTGKTTGGSFLEVEIVSNSGNIVHEVTAFRTGGATDGADGSYSLAFTPNVNGTRDNYIALEGPPMTVEVIGDGTSQTVTVYIANSGSGDYDDDEVWMEVVYPSETGTADFDIVTTQMDLSATPTPVTTETDSTWGTGAGNRQKLSVTISPDYDGFVTCTVFFAKNFGADPETLYVDPLPVIS